jgi:hypothetical protein
MRIRDRSGADSLTLLHDSAQLLGVASLNRRPALMEGDPFPAHLVETVQGCVTLQRTRHFTPSRSTAFTPSGPSRRIRVSS